MQVFRLEHKSDGVGPYQPRPRWPAKRRELLTDFYWATALNGIRCPSPTSYGQPWYKSKKLSRHVFGFSSPAQMKNWFGVGWLRQLKKIGFIVVVYEVRSFRPGLSQISFLPTETKGVWP